MYSNLTPVQKIFLDIASVLFTAAILGLSYFSVMPIVFTTIDPILLRVLQILFFTLAVIIGTIKILYLIRDFKEPPEGAIIVRHFNITQRFLDTVSLLCLTTSVGLSIRSMLLVFYQEIYNSTAISELLITSGIFIFIGLAVKVLLMCTYKDRRTSKEEEY